MKLWRSALRQKSGTAAIEFAVLAPALMLMSYGIYEFGRWAWALEALQESASAGARCVGIGQSSCESSGAYNSGATATYVHGIASGWGLNVLTSNITSTNSTTCGGVSGFSQVQISYVFTTVVTKLVPAGSAGTTLTTSSCFPNNPS